MEDKQTHMKTNLTTFNFNENQVRTLLINDEPWFVASDVAQALDYRTAYDLIRILDEFEKGTHIVRTLGGEQDMSVINESGLFSAILRSRKPEAKAFKKWVTSEVLPMLRKTGSYSLSNEIPQIGKLKPLAEDCMALNQMLLSMGLDKNIAAIGANQAVAKVSGVNLLALTGNTHLISESQERWFTPTELGKLLEPPVSAKKFNLMLAGAGFQTKKTGEWEITMKGKPFARLFDTGKRNNDGVAVTQLKWNKEVLIELDKED